MSQGHCRVVGFCVALVVAVATAHAAEPLPRSHDPRVKIELVAENPQLNTPTGVDVDSQGRVWVVESNTHFPPEGYKGHPTDRILVMSDSDGNGSLDKSIMYADGLTFTMSVAVKPAWLDGPAFIKPEEPAKPAPTTVYLATRKEILVSHDTNGDFVEDDRKRLVLLDTVGNYPHDGLAGFAFDAMGWMYFGCGENLGADYKVVGSDGTTLSGGGEGGNVYRCRPDGTQLTHWATGFWNPHASCFDAFGNMFTVDNDADSRPPCRLLHIIQGGDYGFRYRTGRKGLHPFTAWNGEIPGTLPMVAGTGEAPSGILAYESDGPAALPAEYQGQLFAGSWGDHRIDRFKLKPKGASFESIAEPLITGGEEFRPVGLATAPDGSIYFSDWVLRDYKLHGRGRVWRLSGVKPDAISKSSDPAATDLERLHSPTLTTRRLAAQSLAATSEGRKKLLALLSHVTELPRARVEALWALAWTPVEVEQIAWPVPTILEDANILNNPLVAGADLLALPQFRRSRFAERRSQILELRARQIPMGLYQSDPFLIGMSIFEMSRDAKQFEANWPRYLVLMQSSGPRARDLQQTDQHVTLALAARRVKPKDESIPKMLLKHPAEPLRRIAVQWIAEERMRSLGTQVADLADDPKISADLFLASLAAVQMLNGVNPADFDKTPPGKYVLPIVEDVKYPAALRTLSLRMVSPQDPALDAQLMTQLVASPDYNLRLEAVRTLQSSPLPEAPGMLLALATDTKAPVAMRLEAVLGLAPAAQQKEGAEPVVAALRELTKVPEVELRREALRSLRGTWPADAAAKIAELVPNDQTTSQELVDQWAFSVLNATGPAVAPVASRQTVRPTTTEGWQTLLAQEALAGDPASGRRVFYHANAAGCAKCHTVNGRGGKVGPDLSTIGGALSRERLITSILEPSAEVAPQFVTWAMETHAGLSLSGLIVTENEGNLVLGTSEGKSIDLKTIDIAVRVPQKTSVMPDKLVDRLTVQEFRDLLAYLQSLR